MVLVPIRINEIKMNEAEYLTTQNYAKIQFSISSILELEPFHVAAVSTF